MSSFSDVFADIRSRNKSINCVLRTSMLNLSHLGLYRESLQRLTEHKSLFRVWENSLKFFEYGELLNLQNYWHLLKGT